MRRSVLMVVLLFALLAAQGCGAVADKAGERITEEIVEGGSGNEVDINNQDGSVTITGEGGTTTITNKEGELPKDWPAEIPVYDGTITQSGSSVSADTAFCTASITTKDAGADVKTWYEDQLKAKGWTITFTGESTTDGRTMWTISGTREAWTIGVSISEVTDGTEITITAGK